MAKRRPSGDGMVRKREDGRWEGRIVVGHKDNGEPIFHYVSAKTQKALLDKLHKSIDEYDGAELTEAGHLAGGMRRAIPAAYNDKRLSWLCGTEDQTVSRQQADLQGDHC